MKKSLLYIVLVSIAMLFLTGCSDFLDEKTDGQVFDNVLSTQPGLESALTGAYAGLQTPWNCGFGNGTTIQLTFGGDDVCAPLSDANGTQLDRYAVTSSNGSMGGAWSGCYKAIIGSNKVIDHYKDCSGTQSTITVIAGEAYFLRAFCYYWLVRLHGRVPMVLSSTYNAADGTVAPSEVADIYAQIESDLGQAVSLLDNTRRNSEAGRPNKGTAKALLAEVYLSEAGWPLKKAGYYAKAAAEAKEVLDNKATFGFDFADSYETLYKNRTDANCITSEDEFSITADLDKNFVVNYGDWCMPAEEGGWDVVRAEIGFFKNFPAGIRKDATFLTTFTSQDGKTSCTWENSKSGHPYYKKLMIAGPNHYAYYSNIPIHLLRYTQTALTYAEAKARSGAPDQQAYDCLNAIRERAELPTYSGLSASAFADACVQERAWELCGECVRWFDMTRLDMVQAVVDKRDALDPTPLHTITTADYFLPLPAADILLNPNLSK